MEAPVEDRYLKDDARSLRLWLRELSSRRVGRTAAAYTVVMWVNLQVLDLFIPLLSLPAHCMAFFLILYLLGFPLVIGLAWIFQITERGVVLESSASRDRTRGATCCFVVDGVLLVLATALCAISLLQLIAA